MEEAQIDQLIKPIVAPKSFDEFIGQERAKKLFLQLLNSAKEKNETPDNVMFISNPGCGKSSLVLLVNKDIHTVIVSGLTTEQLSYQIAWNISNKMIFLDEFINLKRGVAETLCYFMDTGILILNGKKEIIGQCAILAATTDASKIPQALLSRFGLVLILDAYSLDNITQILLQAAPKLDIQLDNKKAAMLAKCSRNNPRTSLRIMKRIRDWYQAPLEKDIINVLKDLRINPDGTTHQDVMLLKAVKYGFDGGPVGIETLSAYIGDSPNNIENNYEPFLIRLGLLNRTPSGRMLTAKGMQYV